MVVVAGEEDIGDDANTLIDGSISMATMELMALAARPVLED